jgi:hypothetical protein
MVRKRQYVILPNAFVGASALALDEGDICSCVCDLTAADFYKTMPSEKRAGRMQDVYRVRYIGFPIYLKFDVMPGNVVILSFKRDESV